MGNFLHSLPWTLALALAHAEGASLPSPAEDATQTVAEDGAIPEEYPRILRLASGPATRKDAGKTGMTADLSLED